MKRKLSKDFRKDYYTGLKGVYFYRILEAIIELGNLRNRKRKILDFGSGVGKLKKLLPGKVVNYDILPELTDVSDWKTVGFDVLVGNEVFCYFTEKELLALLDNIRAHNPKAELVVGMSRQGILNKILMVLANEPDAHADIRLGAKEEISTLKKRMEIIKKKNVFFLCNVYLLRFRK